MSERTNQDGYEEGIQSAGKIVTTVGDHLAGIDFGWVIGTTARDGGQPLGDVVRDCLATREDGGQESGYSAASLVAGVALAYLAKGEQ